MSRHTLTLRLIFAGLGLLIYFVYTALSNCLAEDSLKITLTPKTANQPAVFVALGLSEAELARLKSLEPNDPAFSKIFSVYVAEKPTDPAVPPVGGTYRVDGARLVFTPRYPPLPGLQYRAVLSAPSQKPIELELSLPKPATAATKAARVEQIYPSGNMLPENHLRFYIHFSEPIDRGHAYENLELLDQAGKPVEAAFLELGEELWDPSGRRFTLLLDPGRIKQGLKPREEQGPILHNGRKYTLVVKSGWRDPQGQPLAAEFRKSFSVGPVINERIDPKQWKLNAPRTGTIEPFVVRFPRPLDHALLERTLSVVDRQGERISGRIAIADAERRWEFTPESEWASGGQKLVVDTVLEDTAGNSVSRPFEVDEQHPITKAVKTETVTIPIMFVPQNATAK